MNKIEEEELVEEMERVSFEHCNGRPPSRTEFEKYGKYSSSTYQNRYGTWNNALEEILSDVVLEKDISEEILLDDLKSLEKELNRTPRYEDVREKGKFSTVTYQNRFGSWNQALKEAGLGINQKSPTKEELIGEIETLQEELGKIPTIYDIKENGKYSYSSYRNEFGLWENAMEEVGIDYERYESGEEHWAWKGGYEYRGPNWSEARRKVLNRDNHSCRTCGREKEKLGRNPDVHHIKPVLEWDVEREYAEMNDGSNLICLCRKCHLNLEGKWQELDHEQFEKKAKEYQSYND